MQGITPAYAGKTCSTSCQAALQRDHPRLRGKDNVPDDDIEPEVGSPPLTRERRLLVQILVTECRITPAYAGKTPALAASSVCKQDHPRLRGKDCFAM